MGLHHLLRFLIVLPVIDCGSLLDTIIEEGEFVANKIRHISDVSSVYEQVEVCVRDLQRTYGIIIDDYDDLYVLHKELVRFHSLPIALQQEVLAGFPSDFNAIRRMLTELKKVEKKELAKMSDDDREVMEQAAVFVNYIIRVKPLAKIVRNSLDTNGVAKLTPEERKKTITAKRRHLFLLWAGDQQATYEQIMEDLGIDRETYEKEDFDIFGRENTKKEL